MTKQHPPGWFCGGTKRDGTGDPCGLRAGHGTDHPGIGCCRRHGGNTKAHRARAQQQLAERAVATYGLPIEIDPRDALAQELWRTAGHVAWLGQLIAAMEQGELTQLSPGGTYEGYDGEERAILWERPSVWIELYQRERRHLRSVAKDCAAAGVEERRMQLAELLGGQLAQVIGAILRDLDVFDRPETPGVVRKHLAVIEGTVSGGTGAA